MYKRLTDCGVTEHIQLNKPRYPQFIIDLEKNTCDLWRDESIKLVSRNKEWLDNQTRRENKRSYYAKVNSFIHGFGWEE